MSYSIFILINKQHANVNSPTYDAIWRHLDVTALHCSLLLINNCLIKADVKKKLVKVKVY